MGAHLHAPVAAGAAGGRQTSCVGVAPPYLAGGGAYGRKRVNRELPRHKRVDQTGGKRPAGTALGGRTKLIIRLKRAYDPPTAGDGARVLVDREWPRGLSRETIRIAAWLPELGPTTPLRRWFGHDAARWEEFRQRYRRELAQKHDLLQELVSHAQAGKLTLVYGARDRLHNQAVVIKQLLERSSLAERRRAKGVTSPRKRAGRGGSAR